jgi:hypothetical protein
MKMLPLSLLVAAAVGGEVAAAPASLVSLTQSPLVMRLNKDEFRIAFGINGEKCRPKGCHGLIRYRVDWKTEDGVSRSESKQVSYTVSPHAARAIAVDRQYFDTAEGEHLTDIVEVSVDAMTCAEATAGMQDHDPAAVPVSSAFDAGLGTVVAGGKLLVPVPVTVLPGDQG